MKKLILFFWIIFSGLQAQEAPSWLDYAKSRKNGDMAHSILCDFSHAGYHFSEKKIPDVSSWNKINVTDYGANPNDTNYDDAGIKAAISAAQNSNIPTVVYFPAGKYLVSNEATQNSPIIVSKSNIVLKGAGSGPGGTEIYTNLRGNFPWRFHFRPSSMPENKITDIDKRINRGDYEIEVVSAQNLHVGQTVELWHQGIENLALNMPGLSFNPEWNTGKRGIRTLEKHVIKKINGNKITFENPVQVFITADISGAQLNTYNTIEEVGVEDILFTSAWKE